MSCQLHAPLPRTKKTQISFIRRSYQKKRATIFLRIKIYCYVKTKYIILIHWHLLIFLHNPRFSVHIFPTVLEVWIFRCGRSPFQPAEDIDSQLSGVPCSSRYVGLASDSSQNQRDRKRSVPGQVCTDDEGKPPTPCSQFFPRSNGKCEAELHRAAGWPFFREVYRAMHDEAWVESGYNEQHFCFSQVTEIQSRCTSLHPRRRCP